MLKVHRYGQDDGAVLLLLHGLTEAGTAWPDAVARWGSHWRILALDLRGHGESPRLTAAEMEDTWATWIADVLTVVQGLPTPPIIVGHSLGAHLALRVASECPTLVRALVLEDPPLPRVEVPWSREDFAREKEEFLARFDAGDDSEIDRMRIESSWTEPEITAWARCKPLVDRQMIRLEALPTGDWVAVFNRLAVATLLVAPVGSPMAPDPAAINNPLVQIRFVPGVGHCVRRDDPAAYHALVDPFLAAHRPGKV